MPRHLPVSKIYFLRLVKIISGSKVNETRNRRMMKEKLLVVLPVIVGALLASGPIFAHHSNAVFNHEHMTTLTGSVVRHMFTNPHDQIYLNVEEDDGSVNEWIVTGGSPSSMRRVGWHSRMFQPGEQLTVSGHQYRDGRRIMIRMKILRANGEEIPLGGAAGAGFYIEFMEKYGSGSDPSRFSEIGKKRQ